MLPALFLSHGAPTFPLEDVPARHFLSGLADQLPERPRAILIVSAHWETARPAVNVVEINDTIHDFYGFPPQLYEIRYPAAGSRPLAQRVAGLLAEGGLTTDADPVRGLDHGAWVPLQLIYPNADVPVVQLSVQSHLGPEYHLKLGRLLQPLRAEGVLVIGSGSFTHDLSSFGEYRNAIAAPEPEWVASFADWMTQKLEAGRADELIAYRSRAPNAARNHPTEEHLLPLFGAMGAGGEAPARHLHASATYAILRMDVFSFG
jgi:4,5-DOPA dioxygenase extradiol